MDTCKNDNNKMCNNNNNNNNKDDCKDGKQCASIRCCCQLIDNNGSAKSGGCNDGGGGKGVAVEMSLCEFLQTVGAAAPDQKRSTTSRAANRSDRCRPTGCGGGGGGGPVTAAATQTTLQKCGKDKICDFLRSQPAPEWISRPERPTTTTTTGPGQADRPRQQQQQQQQEQQPLQIVINIGSMMNVEDVCKSVAAANRQIATAGRRSDSCGGETRRRTPQSDQCAPPAGACPRVPNRPEGYRRRDRGPPSGPSAEGRSKSTERNEQRAGPQVSCCVIPQPPPKRPSNSCAEQDADPCEKRRDRRPSGGQCDGVGGGWRPMENRDEDNDGASRAVTLMIRKNLHRENDGPAAKATTTHCACACHLVDDGFVPFQLVAI